MVSIMPHLWFDTQAKEAAALYTSLLDDSEITDVTTLHDTPSGDCDIVTFTLAGQPFQAISAGPLFAFNPSISFRIDCATADEVDTLWATLSEGGETLMPLDAYPFSKRYGWCRDRYGLSWQLMLSEEEIPQKIVPMLMFVGDRCGQTEEAVRTYTSIFEGSQTGEIMRYGPGMEPDREGTVQFVPFTIAGYHFAAMDSAHDHDFDFNEAVSIIVGCDDQAELDRYWDALSAVPEAEQCGWLRDRFGVSWQVVPKSMDEMLQTADRPTLDRITQAFLPMKKIDVATLEVAARGG